MVSMPIFFCSRLCLAPAMHWFAKMILLNKKEGFFWMQRSLLLFLLEVLVVLKGFPTAAPLESVLNKFLVAQVVTVDFVAEVV